MHAGREHEARSNEAMTDSAGSTAPTPSALKVPPWASCFRDPNGGPARIMVEQITSNHFRLLTGFEYRGKARTFTITPDSLPVTDLTSVPGPLRWFVSRYGVHTPAALLHDYLLRNGTVLEPTVSRVEADDIFRNALRFLEVPPIRRTLMWTAVVFGTRWASDRLHRIALGSWVAASAIGTIVFLLSLIGGDFALAALTLLAPLAGSLLWGRQALAGITAGYAAPWLLPPTAIGAAGYGVYWLLERATLRLFPESADTDKPVPYEEF